MSFIKCSFLLLCLSTMGVLPSKVSDAFDDAHISSETNIKPPKHLLRVTYGDSDTGIVNLGNKLTLPLIAFQPRFFFKRNPNYYYTLIMIDMDGPKQSGQFMQWMRSNIRGSEIDNGGEENYPYRPPQPTPCDKPHRFTFLLYEHKQKLDFDLDDIMDTAGLLPVIDIKDFAERNLLGDPKYGNYYNGVSDTSVQAMCEDTGISYDTNNISLMPIKSKILK